MNIWEGCLEIMEISAVKLKPVHNPLFGFLIKCSVAAKVVTNPDACPNPFPNAGSGFGERSANFRG
jgi:hypothetical protein